MSYRRERYIQIEPMQISPGSWMRFVVRQEGLLAVVAQFHAGWNRKNNAANTLPGVTSISVHRPASDTGSGPCLFLHDSSSMFCSTSEIHLPFGGPTADGSVRQILKELLLKEGSTAVLDYLENEIYIKELEK